MHLAFRILLPLALITFLACKEKSAQQGAAPGGSPSSDSATASAAMKPVVPKALMGKLGGIPVWFDLNIPATDGPVAGTYLYIKHAKDIPVSGKRIGDTLVLEESVAGKVTGVFRLRPYADGNQDGERWAGTWTKPGKQKSLEVDLNFVPADFKPCQLANPESLMVSEMRSLAFELESNTQSDEELEEQSRNSGETLEAPVLSVIGCADGLMTAGFTRFYHPGGRPIVESEPFLWTFDLAGKRAINLWDEIDSAQVKAFSKYLADLLTARLEEMNMNNPDEEESKPADTAHFEIGDLSEARIKLEEGVLKAGFLNYFQISESEAAEREIGPREVWEVVAPAELRKFLKKNSVLNAFGAKR